MKPEEIKEQLGDLPFMTLAQGQEITEFLHRHDLTRILELGFFHGVSSCYFAGAMEAVNGYPIVTIDLPSAKNRTPNIEALLDRCNLENMVEFHYVPEGYNTRLMEFIEKKKRRFDFCYIDGGHDWYNTGFGFFLVDKLLEPGGWILFDDLDWTMEHRNEPWALKYSPEERATAQVRKVWELLVKEHPCYGRFREQGRWAFAQKVKE